MPTKVVADRGAIVDKGTVTFTIESRILRELGERLVKEPEVALLELVKNSFDADSAFCELLYEPPERIVVSDSGHGMTLAEFKAAWMRIGTSAKEASATSRRYGRVITGEKGIGRFAVRFLGRALRLDSVADDETRGFRTHLSATFDWPTFDKNEDLGLVRVPYELKRAVQAATTGTRLLISKLRPEASNIDLYGVRTGSIAVLTPYQALLRPPAEPPRRLRLRNNPEPDPGFSLRIFPPSGEHDDEDLAATLLSRFILRAVVDLQGQKLKLTVYRSGREEPVLEITDTYPNSIAPVYADIRFYPQRKGTFTDLPVDGRRAKSWIKKHSGVAVFDRTFRVHPYGMEGDDWLSLSADTAKRERDPRSSIAKKHFPMDEPTYQSTQLNYMLRLPYPQQLVGVVQVQGRRTSDQTGDDGGLIAAADREGFVNNRAFRQLFDVIRGAVEAIAAQDRELQQELDREEQQNLFRLLRQETRDAIREIESNPAIARHDKAQTVKRLSQAQLLVEKSQERFRERETTLETMSLLGVVAGFMTHEFGTALDELERAQQRLAKLARRDSDYAETAMALNQHIASLRDFVTYSQGYIQGAASRPARPYPARPRLQQVVRVFGKYAAERDIEITIGVESDVLAPLVPVSLYNGVALNLFTNALKAVTARSGSGARVVAFRAWNDQQSHYLEISDTGIGIPSALRRRVFDPLFTTTAGNRDPLGSGLGLGLSLVKRGVENYGGRVDVVDPPAGFSTCFRVRLPLSEET